MGMPTPGKARRRRVGSYRNLPHARQSHRTVVSTLLTTNRPAGSYFYVFDEEDEARTTDESFLESRKRDLKKHFGEEMGWYNVEEHSDAMIWCTCGEKVPVSMKILALRARMAELGHIPMHTDIGEASCPKCGDVTVLDSGMMITVASLTRAGGIPTLLERSLIRAKLVKRLEYNGEVYGPEWLDGVTTPTLRLSDGDPKDPGPNASVFSTTVKDLRRLVDGDCMYEDSRSMTYMRNIPVIGEVGEGHFVIEEDRWVDDTFHHIILGGLLVGRRSDQKIFISAVKEWDNWKRFRVYFDEKYLSLGLYYHNNYFEWRDEIG